MLYTFVLGAAHVLFYSITSMYRTASLLARAFPLRVVSARYPGSHGLPCAALSQDLKTVFCCELFI